LVEEYCNPCSPTPTLRISYRSSSVAEYSWSACVSLINTKNSKIKATNYILIDFGINTWFFNNHWFYKTNNNKVTSVIIKAAFLSLYTYISQYACDFCQHYHCRRFRNDLVPIKTEYSCWLFLMKLLILIDTVLDCKWYSRLLRAAERIARVNRLVDFTTSKRAKYSTV
jgi:hypothetical protein